ncbi:MULTISPECIES: tetratricopeptide repeat protein [Flammeovirga]|uniref:Tetratricopeptide repeat-containing protein n=1 Tax=Flammeovirga agarivorans TaxID=2726742 RepID=A0A7X8SM41_9BACT|nr:MULTISPECIES: hypothetical protein [Flammeovirga]NLR92754.1 hypothetical protein [Flammeovirga agarivorans]
MDQSVIEKIETLLKEEKFDGLFELINPLTNTQKGKELLGLYYLGKWENEKAEEVFEKLKEEFSTNPDYHYYYGASLGQQAKGANMLKLMQIAPKSKAAFDKALELDPQHVPAHWGLLRYFGNAPAMFGGEPKCKELADSLSKFNEKEANDAYEFIKNKFHS